MASTTILKLNPLPLEASPHERIKYKAAWQTRKEAAKARGEGNLAQLYVERAEGSEMWDVEGNRYIDFATVLLFAILDTLTPK